MKPSLIHPLDGSPQISDNCWSAILDTLRDRGRGNKPVRYLEWGAGNSTLSVLTLGLETNAGIEITSIDHSTEFFPTLAESLIEKATEYGDTHVSWRPLKPYAFSFAHLSQLLADRHLISSPFTWTVIWGNDRIQWTEGYVPRFGFPLFTIMRNKVKLLLVEGAYWWWIIRGLVRGLLSTAVEPYELAKEHVLSSTPGSFAAWFSVHSSPGALTLTRGNTSLTFWHLPIIKNICWNRGLLVDGSATQLPSFVGVPLTGTFDVVLVDGRARVPCIMRVDRDRLVVRGGRLFVHDAFREEMSEAFLRFGPIPTFINGSNRMLNGARRCRPDYGPPLMWTGLSLTSLAQEIVQELFVWENVD